MCSHYPAAGLLGGSRSCQNRVADSRRHRSAFPCGTTADDRAVFPKENCQSIHACWDRELSQRKLCFASSFESAPAALTIGGLDWSCQSGTEACRASRTEPIVRPSPRLRVDNDTSARFRGVKFPPTIARARITARTGSKLVTWPCTAVRAGMTILSNAHTGSANLASIVSFLRYQARCVM